MKEKPSSGERKISVINRNISSKKLKCNVKMAEKRRRGVKSSASIMKAIGEGENWAKRKEMACQ
jgi:hypothetical protein